MTNSELEDVRKKVILYRGQWVFDVENDRLVASILTEAGSAHSVDVGEEINWIHSTLPKLENEKGRTTDEWAKWALPGNEDIVDNLRNKYLEIDGMTRVLESQEQQLQNELSIKRKRASQQSSGPQQSRKARLRNVTYPRLRSEAIKLSEEEQKLLSDFISRLPDDVTDQVVQLDKKIGGSVADTIIIQADQGDADRTLLETETFLGVLTELYRPFLNLDMATRNNLVRLSEDAFRQWLTSTYVPYLDDQIRFHIEQELVDAGVATLPEEVRQVEPVPPSKTLRLEENEHAMNIFRRYIGIYEIRFNGGEVVRRPEVMGMRHIAILLGSPHKEIDTAEFVDEPEGRITERQSLDEGLTTTRVYDKNLDEEAKAQLKSRARRILEVEIPALRGNLQDLERHQSTLEIEECEKEIEKKMREAEQIEKQLKGGKYHTQDSGPKKIQNALRKNIMDALKKLKEDKRTVDFAEHFHKHFSGGRTFSYNPPQEERWLIS